MVWVWEAFVVLSRARPVGMAPGAIPVSEMLAYAQAFGVGDLEEFMRYLQAADEVYLGHKSDGYST